MLRALFSVLYYSLFVAITSLALLLVASFFPFDNWYQVKVVLSGSMEPAIHTGSIVFIKPAVSYQVGDVITFGRDTRTQVPVTHRIVGEEGGEFLTKGDANGDLDAGTVAAREVIGKVWFSIPYVGFILEFAKTPPGFITLVVVPGAFIALSEIFKIFREIYRVARSRPHVVPEHIDQS